MVLYDTHSHHKRRFPRICSGKVFVLTVCPSDKRDCTEWTDIHYSQTAFASYQGPFKRRLHPHWDIVGDTDRQF